MFEKLLDHPNINVNLNKKFDSKADVSRYDYLFLTGPLDQFLITNMEGLPTAPYFLKKELQGETTRERRD